MKKISILLFCACVFSANIAKAGTEVAAWVQNGFGSVSLTNLQSAHGGVNPKDVLTTICIQFWAPTSGGGVTQLNDPSALVSWAHANGVKAFLTVYNAAGGSWDWGLATSATGNADAFSTALVNAMTNAGMDGIDLDLEGAGLASADDNRTQYKAFITALSTKVKAKGKLLSVCSFDDPPDPSGTNNVPNTGWWGDWAGKADYVHTMLYAEGGEANLEGIGDGIQGDDQYYYSTQQQIGVAAGLPASAVSMGLPSFDSENAGTWNQGWSTHLDQCLAINASICIWDLQLQDANWSSSAALWQKLAKFKANANNFSLSITATTGGKVTTNPTGTSFTPNTQVTLTAVPSAGFKFSAWSGDATGSTSPLTVTMNANKSITATFALTNATPGFDMFANGTWDSYIDDYGSKITMTKPTGSVAATWTLVKMPTDNDYPYVGINVEAPAGSFTGLTSVVVTYKSTSNLLISLTDSALAGDGDCYQYSLPPSTTGSTVTLATSDFQQPSDPTTVGPLRLNYITDLDFTPDMELSTTTGGAGSFSITALMVNGTTLNSGTGIANKSLTIANTSASPIIKKTLSGLEISNVRDTKSIVVYNALGRSIATIMPSMSQHSVMKIPMGKTSGILFVRFIGTNGASSVQRIIR